MGTNNRSHNQLNNWRWEKMVLTILWSLFVLNWLNLQLMNEIVIFIYCFQNKNYFSLKIMTVDFSLKWEIGILTIIDESVSPTKKFRMALVLVSVESKCQCPIEGDPAPWWDWATVATSKWWVDKFWCFWLLHLRVYIHILVDTPVRNTCSKSVAILIITLNMYTYNIKKSQSNNIKFQNKVTNSRNRERKKSYLK